VSIITWPSIARPAVSGTTAEVTHQIQWKGQAGIPSKAELPGRADRGPAAPVVPSKWTGVSW